MPVFRPGSSIAFINRTYYNVTYLLLVTEKWRSLVGNVHAKTRVMETAGSSENGDCGGPSHVSYSKNTHSISNGDVTASGWSVEVGRGWAMRKPRGAKGDNREM